MKFRHFRALSRHMELLATEETLRAARAHEAVMSEDAGKELIGTYRSDRRKVIVERDTEEFQAKERQKLKNMITQINAL